MKNLKLLLLLAVCGIPACLLEKEPEIPTGLSNEILPTIYLNKFVQTSLDSVLVRATVDPGNADILHHGLVWSKNASPTIEDDNIDLGELPANSSDLEYEVAIGGLEQGTPYYFRPYATTFSGTTYGYEDLLLMGPLTGVHFGGNGTDYGNSVQQTTDGGFILLGRFEKSSTDYDMYLVKTNAAGDLLWEKTYGGYGYDEGHSVQQTTDGGFILLGGRENTTSGFGYYDYMYLVKTNATGDTLWQNTIGGDFGITYGYSVQQTADEGYILLGSVDDSNIGKGIYLLKTNSTGDRLWHNVFGGAHATGYSVQQTSDGGYILLGEAKKSGSDYYNDMYLVKTNALGGLTWERRFSGGKDNTGYSVQQTSDGGYILLGETTRPDNQGRIMYVVKTDATGNKMWENKIGGLFPESSGYSVQQTPDGGYILLGEVWSNLVKMYLVKINASGVPQWEKHIGGTDFEIGQSVQQTTDGGFILLGGTNSFGASGFDMYLVKTDQNGNVIF